MALEETIISTFSNIKDRDNPINVPLMEWLEKIKSGEYCKNVINEIRKTDSHEAQNYLKTRLLGVGCPSGVFGKRKDTELISMNPVICLDLDDVKYIRKETEALKKNPCVVAVFLSPSGKGLKVVIHHDLTDPHKHKELYSYLGNELGLTGNTDLTFDLKCSNISRACFNSYSKDMYIKRKATAWHIEPDKLKSPITGKSPITVIPSPLTVVPEKSITILTDPEEINEAIIREHEFFERYYSMYPGNRNSNLYLLASFMKDSGIPEKTASDYLVAYYMDSANGFTGEEISKTIKSAYKN